MGLKFSHKARLLFLRALTPVHAGAGRGALEHVDLPVQRDEFGFPCIWASSLKGAVRGCLERAGRRQGSQDFRNCLYATLGPPPERAYEHSSAANFLDARLLLLPARSLRGVWTYITSPHLVGYACTYLEALGMHDLADSLVKRLDGLQLPAASRKGVLLDGSRAVLNELDVEVRSLDEELPSNLFGGLLPEELLALVSRRGLVVLDDDIASELVHRGMLVQYRVRLKRDAKTVDVGPWTEEYVPQGTVFVSAVVCRSVARRGCEDPCGWLENALRSLNNVLWLGGKETVGKGLLKLYLVVPQGGGP